MYINNNNKYKRTIINNNNKVRIVPYRVTVPIIITRNDTVWGMLVPPAGPPLGTVHSPKVPCICAVNTYMASCNTKSLRTVKTTEAPVETAHGQDYWVSSVETRISAAIAIVKTTEAPVETEHGQDYWVSSVETNNSQDY